MQGEYQAKCPGGKSYSVAELVYKGYSEHPFNVQMANWN